MDNLSELMVEHSHKWALSKPTTVLFYMNGKIAHCNGNTACIAGINSVHGADRIGVGMPIWLRDPDDRNVAQDYLRWVTSSVGPYKSLVNFLGDDLVYVEDGEDLVGIHTGKDVNLLAITNFFKSVRCTSEQNRTMDFWKKWKIKNKIDPRVVWLLMHFFNTNGQKSIYSHGVIDGGIDGSININRFVNYDHNDWKLEDYLRSQKSSYTGERDHMWGRGKFSVKSIRKVGELKLKTVFVSIYENKKSDGLTDKDIFKFNEEFHNYAN